MDLNFSLGSSKRPPLVESTITPADKIARSETLIDIEALIGPTLLLKNGSFIRMIEVAPVDLEGVDPSVRNTYFLRFGDCLKLIRAPLSVQIVITSHPQDVSEYIGRWQAAADTWAQYADNAIDWATADRRNRMERGADETAEFLDQTMQRVMPMQQRYFLVISYNPFAEGRSDKKREALLNPTVVTDAIETLEERAALVKSAFSGLNLPLYDLDPPEMCIVLWEHYHHPRNLISDGLSPTIMFENQTRTDYRAEQCPKREQIILAAAEPARLADLIAPALLAVETEFIRVGDVVGRGYNIYDFDIQRPVNIGSILALSIDMTHALYFTPADPVAIRQKLRDKEIAMKSNQTIDDRRGAVTDWGRNSAINSAEAMRADLEIALQAPFDLHWFCMVWASDTRSLDKQCQNFETTLRTQGIMFRPATRMQMALYDSLRPLNKRSFNVQGRNMSADSLGSFFPFVRREYFNPGGWHYGLHRGNGMLVSIDPMERGRLNGSELVVGTLGSGKSVYLKSRIETLLGLGARVFVIDPEREYARLAADWHGTYLELGKQTRPPLLPFVPPEFRNEDPFAKCWLAIKGMFEAMSGRLMLTDEETGLAIHCEEILADTGITRSDSSTWETAPPTLELLVDRLMKDPQCREVGRVLSYPAKSMTGGSHINILKINTDSETPIVSTLHMLYGFIEVAIGQSLNPKQKNILANTYKQLLIEFGIDLNDPGSAQAEPTLSSLVKMLKSQSSTEARDLGEWLEQYASGLYADLFNHRTNVDVGKSQLVVFSLRAARDGVEKRLMPLYTWQVLQMAWNAAISGAPSGQPFYLVVDESKVLIQFPNAAQYLEEMARTLRKYHGALLLAFHGAEDLLQSTEAKVITNVGRIRVLFGQGDSSAAEKIGALFGLSNAEIDSLKRARKGDALLMIGNDMRIPIYVPVDPRRIELLSTNAEQQQRLAIATGRKVQPVL